MFFGWQRVGIRSTTTTTTTTEMFAQFKRESLRKLRAAEDKSPKGSIDAPIVDLIRLINNHPNYVRAAAVATVAWVTALLILLRCTTVWLAGACR